MKNVCCSVVQIIQLVLFVNEITALEVEKF
jgi:hypothetical protein